MANTKHTLKIHSLHDLSASCSCGKWHVTGTGEHTKDDVEDEHNFHVRMKTYGHTQMVSDKKDVKEAYIDLQRPIKSERVRSFQPPWRTVHVYKCDGCKNEVRVNANSFVGKHAVPGRGAIACPHCEKPKVNEETMSVNIKGLINSAITKNAVDFQTCMTGALGEKLLGAIEQRKSDLADILFNEESHSHITNGIGADGQDMIKCKCGSFVEKIGWETHIQEHVELDESFGVKIIHRGASAKHKSVIGAKVWAGKHKVGFKKELSGSRIKKIMKEDYLEEGGPTRKHFVQVASIINQIPDPVKRKELADHHAQIFASQNPRFNHDIWHKACGTHPSQQGK
jgi:hypothetical protein